MSDPQPTSIPSLSTTGFRQSGLSAPQQIRLLGAIAGLAVFLPGVLGRFPFFGDALPHSQSAIPCLFKLITHLPCLFCGLTRSFTLITQGQWQEAQRYHPLGFPLYAGLLLFFLAAALAPGRLYGLSTGWPRRLPGWTLWAGLGILLAGAWWLKLSGDPAYW